jgi:hypothetical protein
VKRQVSIRVHTRKIDRGVIKHQLKKQGCVKPNKRVSDEFRRLSYEMQKGV